MGVSVDTRQIEKLTQLQATLELLQNPESYTSLLADVKDVLKRYDVASKRYSTTEAAEAETETHKATIADLGGLLIAVNTRQINLANALTNQIKARQPKPTEEELTPA